MGEIHALPIARRAPGAPERRLAAVPPTPAADTHQEPAPHLVRLLGRLVALRWRRSGIALLALHIHDSSPRGLR